MAIHDADHPTTVHPRGKREAAPSVKQLSELGKLVSSLDSSHFHTGATEPFDLTRKPDLEVRDPVLEAIPSAPVNLAPSFNPQPQPIVSSNLSTKGTTEMNTQTALNNTTSTAIAAGTASGSDQALAAVGATPTPAVIPAALGTTAGVTDVPAPAGSYTNNTAASASAIAGSTAAPAAGASDVSVATPNMGKISRRVGLGLDTLMFKPEGEQALYDNLNTLVANNIEVRDEVTAIADRLAALEARRSALTITTSSPDWKEEVPKQIAIGAGIGLVTYAGIVLISKGVEMLMGDGSATATE